MPYAYKAELVSGEKRPLWGSVTAPPIPAGGTITLTGAGTFSLFDNNGVIVPGFSAIAGTGYDGTPQPSVRVWYNLDTSGLATGNYSVEQAFPGYATADAIARVFIVKSQLVITAPTEVAASYVLSATVGQTRLYLADTGVNEAIFSDAELTQILSDTGGVPRIAAATALEIAASDAAKCAIIAKNENISTDVTKIPELLLATAARMRANYAPVAVVISNDQIFSMTSGSGTVPGTMTVW